MRKRWQSIVSVTALVVAVFGATPIGEAAGRVVAQVPPFAKRADFAKRAGTADNAKKLGGRTATAYARLDANGKVPLTLIAGSPKGDPGPKGDKGDKGDKGEKGDKGDRGPAGIVAAYSKATGTSGAFQPLTTGSNKLVALTLPAGCYVILAQATIARDVNGQGAQLFGGCRLSAGDDKATAVVAGAKAPGPTFQVASTVLLHEFTASGIAELNCNDATFGQSSWADARITAIQVVSSRIAQPGGGVKGP